MLNTIKYVQIFYASSSVKLYAEKQLDSPNITVSITSGHEHEICFFRSKLLRSNYAKIEPCDFKPSQRIEFKCYLTGDTAVLEDDVYYERYECLLKSGEIQEFIIVK